LYSQLVRAFRFPPCALPRLAQIAEPALILNTGAARKHCVAMAIRILIVDDSALFRQGVRDTLESNRDWELCGEAADGRQAIEGNRSLTPHLIVMDFSMPGMTGLEAASEILKEFPKLPILLLTRIG
jgi:PleD family two-component response regulator